MFTDRQQRIAGPDHVAAAQFQRIDIERDGEFVSSADSTANVGWVMPYPRSAPLGTVFVYTA